MADSEPERIGAQIVSESYFSVLRVELALGHGFPRRGTMGGFLPDDETTATSVVISDGMWRQRFGSDPGILGSAVRLNGQPFTIVGVAPEGFRGFRVLDPVPEVWVPFSSQPFTMPAGREMFETRGDFWLSLVGRLEPGVTHLEAQAAVDVVAARLVETFYSQFDGEIAVAVDQHFSLSASARKTTATILSLLMAVVGPFPDLGVLAFALGVALITGLLFGLAPALHASRCDVTHVLGDTSASGRPRLAGRNFLVVAQVALSVVLLVASGLFVRSLRSLQSVDPGFEPEGLVIASVDLRPQGYDRSETHALYRQLLEAVGSRPDVGSATLGSTVPLRGSSQRGGNFLVEGREPREGVGFFDTTYNVVGPGYFKTLGIPLVRGREFTFDDTAAAPGVLIVNESFARLIWPGEEPLGKRIRRGRGEPFLEVVGLVRDVKEYGLGADPEPTFYRPIFQRFERGLTLMVRPSGEPEPLFGVVREEVRSLNPNLPVYGVRTLDDVVEASSAPLRTNATLTSLFGVLALVLASVGLYGLIAYSVTQRMREIGIRMALGARRGAVVRLVIARGVALTGLGLALGLAAAGLATRFIQGMLFAVSPVDPAAFAAAATVLAGIALFACYLPARRASRVDPVEVLRVD